MDHINGVHRASRLAALSALTSLTSQAHITCHVLLSSDSRKPATRREIRMAWPEVRARCGWFKVEGIITYDGRGGLCRRQKVGTRELGQTWKRDRRAPSFAPFSAPVPLSLPFSSALI